VSTDTAPGRQTLPDAAAVTGDGGAKISYDHQNALVRQVYPESEADWIFTKLEAVVAKLRHHFKFDLTGFYEGGQIYHYPKDGFLGWHMDIGLGMMSRRKLGVSVELTPGEDYEGGDLEFVIRRAAPPGKWARLLYSLPICVTG